MTLPLTTSRCTVSTLQSLSVQNCPIQPQLPSKLRGISATHWIGSCAHSNWIQDGRPPAGAVPPPALSLFPLLHQQQQQPQDGHAAELGQPGHQAADSGDEGHFSLLIIFFFQQHKQAAAASSRRSAASSYQQHHQYHQHNHHRRLQQQQHWQCLHAGS